MTTKHTLHADRKRNPQDTTLRNVRAAKKREETIAQRVKILEQRMTAIECDLARTVKRLLVRLIDPDRGRLL